MNKFIKEIIRKNPNKKGFTLLEILLVIAAIGILSSIVIVAINPLRQLGKARNVVRTSDISTIQKALDQYFIQEGNYPNSIVKGQYIEICDTGSLKEGDPLPSIDYCEDKIDLRELVPQYIAAIPKDPQALPGNTGYELAQTYFDELSIRSQTPELSASIVINPIPFSFVKQLGGSAGASTDISVASFADGSSVIAGSFEGDTTLGLGEVNETTLINAGGRDIFIAKYNIDGTLAWAKRAGGINSDYGATYISTFSDGSSVITGAFSDQAVFGEGEINETTLGSDGGLDIFVARYNSDGTLAWVKSSGGTSTEYGFAIESNDIDGSSIVTGYFTGGTSTFGEGEANETLLSSTGGPRGFIAKYDLNGNVIWAKLISSTGVTLSYGVHDYSDGSLVVTGYFTSSAVFGPGEINQTTLVPSGIRNMFVARYNSDGTLVWVKQASGNSWGRNIQINNLDNTIYVVGFFGENLSSATFGLGESNEVTLNGEGSSDMFVAKYDSLGNLLWAKSGGGIGSDLGVDITVNSDGSSVIAGAFSGQAIFGKGEVNETIINSAGAQDAFIAKYSSNGNLLWVRRAGGTGQDSAGAIANNIGGGVIVGGLSKDLQILEKEHKILQH